MFVVMCRGSAGNGRAVSVGLTSCHVVRDQKYACRAAEWIKQIVAELKRRNDGGSCSMSPQLLSSSAAVAVAVYDLLPHYVGCRCGGQAGYRKSVYRPGTQAG